MAAAAAGPAAPEFIHPEGAWEVEQTWSPVTGLRYPTWKDDQRLYIVTPDGVYDSTASLVRAQLELLPDGVSPELFKITDESFRTRLQSMHGDDAGNQTVKLWVVFVGQPIWVASSSVWAATEEEFDDLFAARSAALGAERQRLSERIDLRRSEVRALILSTAAVEIQELQRSILTDVEQLGFRVVDGGMS